MPTKLYKLHKINCFFVARKENTVSKLCVWDMNLADKYVVITDIWGKQHQGFLRQVKEEQDDTGQVHIKLVLQETPNPSSLRTVAWFVTWLDSVTLIRYEYRFEDEFVEKSWTTHGGLYDSSYLKTFILSSQKLPSLS